LPLASFAGTAVCGNLLSGVHQFGVDLETKHEHDIAVDVVCHDQSICERKIFGQLFGSAGPC
jgi:hypothetical protein